MKNRSTAIILCLLLGVLGAHQYYLGNYGKGVLYTLTGGLLGIGWLYDLVKLIINPDSIMGCNCYIKNNNNTINTYDDNGHMQSNNDVVRCPRCGSTQLTANKKGFSLVKGVVGACLVNPITGVATGMLGKNKIVVTCLKCGKQFKAGKGR
ncbi:TM2 domain-containing protein [Clostridium sp.]|uniref:TM2 domain-containing protein n=1 Tax=Clostridium sp. TaxID=1506 RepID=UPI0026344808